MPPTGNPPRGRIARHAHTQSSCHRTGIYLASEYGMFSCFHLSRRTCRAWLPIACSMLWLGATAGGMAMLWKFENVPGPRLAVPAAWPAASRIPRKPGLATLVMFVHPQCPCTRASVGELARVMAQSQGRVRASVLFFKPRGCSDSWAQTDLWRAAAAIPGVKVQCDDDGAEAARFGATTSGFVLLYDRSGKLGYNGGITAERGHAGDNDGESAVIAILNGREPRIAAMPVLGCSIEDAQSQCVAKEEQTAK
jgi:hypothetical protein